jgi:hypothetical protein
MPGRCMLGVDPVRVSVGEDVIEGDAGGFY